MSDEDLYPPKDAGAGEAGVTILSIVDLPPGVWSVIRLWKDPDRKHVTRVEMVRSRRGATMAAKRIAAVTGEHFEPYKTQPRPRYNPGSTARPIPFQPSPAGFGKTDIQGDTRHRRYSPSRAASTRYPHGGLLLVAHRDARDQWWAKAPQYSHDYLAVGGTFEEAFQNIRKVLDAKNVDTERQSNPGPTQGAGELARSLKF